jgi:predicted Zn-dependent protease
VGRWGDARAAIESELLADPDNHWLLTRLSTTFYEQFEYRRALRISERAMKVAPKCPLVLWDYAGSLQMIGRHEDAAGVYRRLIRRGVDAVASDPCGEGVRRARGLIADCHFRLSACYRSAGRKLAAIGQLSRHMEMRGPGCPSIYSFRQVTKFREKLLEERPNPALHRDAPGLSRPLQGKGRASPSRAGKRER